MEIHIAFLKIRIKLDLLSKLYLRIAGSAEAVLAGIGLSPTVAFVDDEIPSCVLAEESCLNFPKMRHWMSDGQKAPILEMMRIIVLYQKQKEQY
jgi:hypothetical protein